MGEEGFGSGEWIGEGIDKTTPASLDNMMMTKPAPHKATASGLMPANEDEAMTTKPAPHEAAASGQMPASNEAMTKKPAPHKAATSGQLPAYEDEAMTTKLAPHEAAASGQMPADEDEPLVRKIFVFIEKGVIPCIFFDFWLFNVLLFASLWQQQEQHKAAASGRMLADKAMAMKPACGDNPSIDDKELAVAVDKDKEEPLAVDQLKKMPKRSRRFGRVMRGVPSRSKWQRTNTNINLDVHLDVVSAPINVTIDPPIQDSTVSADNYTHVPPQADVITQLRRKVRDSTARNDKLTQVVAELKNEVRDLKHHSEYFWTNCGSSWAICRISGIHIWK
jgi:hypothetical protein